MQLIFEQLRAGGDRNFGYLLGDRDTGPATRVKDTCPRWKADNEIIQQRNVRRIATT